MATRALLIACAVLGCVALAAAQAQICDDKATPLQPKNSLLTSNTYDAASKKAVAKITWRNALVNNPKGGCITGYRVMTYDGNTGNPIGSSFVQATSMQDPVKTEVQLQPGKKTTIKIVATNKEGKQSPPETVGTITTAAAPVTAVPI